VPKSADCASLNSSQVIDAQRCSSAGSSLRLRICASACFSPVHSLPSGLNHTARQPAADEDDGEELAAADGDVADDDSESDSPAPAKGKAKKAVEVEELPSVEAKQKERDALARAMEEFLSRGGKVQEVEPNVVSDPPKKPDSKYGSRPI